MRTQERTNNPGNRGRSGLVVSGAGFTLIELMAVLAILSILSTAAVMSYQRYIRQARSMEAIHMLSDIGMKQATYFSIYGQYVDTVSSNKINEDDPNDFYPKTIALGNKPWAMSCPADKDTYPGWCALGVRPASNKVNYQYATVGWAPGETGTPPSDRISDPSRKWWYAVARGDIDNNGLYSTFILSSEVSEVYSIYPNQ